MAHEPQAQINCCILRRQHREATAEGIGPGTTAMYMQRTTSGAAGNGLNTTIKTSSTCVCKPTVESCVDTTAKLRPQASVLALRAAGANQLLRPASTTPRSYGRRLQSWHADFKHAATRQPRRKPTVETCVDTTAKLRPQASVLALRAAGDINIKCAKIVKVKSRFSTKMKISVWGTPQFSKKSKFLKINLFHFPRISRLFPASPAISVNSPLFL